LSDPVHEGNDYHLSLEFGGNYTALVNKWKKVNNLCLECFRYTNKFIKKMNLYKQQKSLVITLLEITALLNSRTS
jgi:hypothetical protein